MRTLIKALIVILSVVSSSVAAEEPLRLRVMTYNLRFGELASLEELAEHIKAFDPDFVALQEVDVRTQRERAPLQNGKDFLSELAYRTGRFGLYGKAIDYRGGYYGVAILSKHPYISVDKRLLPNSEPKTEQRVLLSALFEVGRDTVRFASTHLEVTSEELREKQAAFISDYFSQMQDGYPTLLGGDFNALSQSRTIQLMDSVWQSVSNPDASYPTSMPEGKIDYLFAMPKNGWRVIWSQTVKSTLSDHLPVLSLIEYSRSL